MRAPSVLAGAALLFGLAACEAPPRKAEQIRALSTSPLDQGLSWFQEVCVASAPNFANFEARKNSVQTDGKAFFSLMQTKDGRALCSMRARAPGSENVLQALQSRYGPPRLSGGIALVFENTPYGDLLFQQGVSGGAGEGTYQIGIIGAQS